MEGLSKAFLSQNLLPEVQFIIQLSHNDAQQSI